MNMDATTGFVAPVPVIGRAQYQHQHTTRRALSITMMCERKVPVRAPSVRAPRGVQQVQGQPECASCEGKGAISCETCSHLGFVPITEEVWGTCKECRGSGRLICVACDVSLVALDTGGASAEGESSTGTGSEGE